MAKYVDDKIEYIADDVEKIKRKSGMYISYKGPKGALHLAKEVINNGIDEVINDKSPGKKIDIFVEELENRITVSDDGRGVPFDKVELICTKIQTGSKFDRNDKSDMWKPEDQTAGENGVGLTAVNSLSASLRFVIFREGQKGIFEFIDGKLASKKITKVSARDSAKHGTMVSFTPSEKCLGACKFNIKELDEWVSNMSYILDPQYHLTYSILQKGKDQIKSTVLVHKHGLIDLVDTMVKKEAVDPIAVAYTGSYLYEENGNVKLIPLKLNKNHLGKGIIVKAAFTLNDGEDRGTDETNYMSFCNFVNTVDHGVHVNAAKNAWCTVVSKLANDSLSDTEAKRYQISFDDARKGLHFAISIMNSTPQFASQTKEKISNEELFKPIRFIIMNELNAYFRKNPTDLKRVINYVKSNARARLEVSKIRKSEYKPMDNLSENTMKCFMPAIGRDYQELFIVEGNSALGQLKLCRDARTQALFALRGVPKNTFGIKIAEVLTNQEFKYLIKCLGCGLGADFDPNKLKYDKIIIFTDSDIDGFRIASLVSVFFLSHFPEIVKAGKLYKVDAPLYILEDKKHPYMLNKAEYYKLFGENLTRQIELSDMTGKKLSNRELIDLVTNSNYLNYLGVLVNDYSINPDVVEFLTLKANTKNLDKDIKKNFTELRVTTDENGLDTVMGVYQDNYQYITIDEDFYHKIKSLYDLMYGENEGNIYYSCINKTTGKEYKNITLGQFFRLMTPYMPKIKERLKGLGEMSFTKLWETSMDPHNRRLKRLTTDSIKHDLEQFNILHGPNPDLRKTLMGDYILNRDDIDN